MRRLAVVVLLCIIVGMIAGMVPNASGQHVPEEAKQHILQGKNIIEQARGPLDYLKAQEEFEKAIGIAPEWPDAHYNLALISEELGQEIKAMKSYEKYLQLANTPADKNEVLADIERLKRARETKKKIGMPGVALTALKDGIYLRSFGRFSKLHQAGFNIGDKIVKVNERDAVGIKLEEFYRLLETSFDGQSLGETVQAHSRDKDSKKSVSISIIRGGSPKVIIAPHDAFKSIFFEIEDDEVEEEVIRSPRPVFVVFWADWCQRCGTYLAMLESQAEKHKDEAKFVSINATYNKKVAERFGIRQLPTVLYFKNGSQISAFRELSGDPIGELLATGSISGKGENKNHVAEDILKGLPGIQPSAARYQEKTGKEELGATLKAVPVLKDASREKLGMAVQREQGGFRIMRVLPGSLAERSGLKVGDKIVRINSKELGSFSELEFLNSLESEQNIILYIQRRGE
ncbi:MAG: thioredoxin domain-containing protein [Nitrospirota bacterium]